MCVQSSCDNDICPSPLWVLLPHGLLLAQTEAAHDILSASTLTWNAASEGSLVSLLRLVARGQSCSAKRLFKFKSKKGQAKAGQRWTTWCILTGAHSHTFLPVHPRWLLPAASQCGDVWTEPWWLPLEGTSPYLPSWIPLSNVWWQRLSPHRVSPTLLWTPLQTALNRAIAQTYVRTCMQQEVRSVPFAPASTECDICLPTWYSLSVSQCTFSLLVVHTVPPPHLLEWHTAHSHTLLGKTSSSLHTTEQKQEVEIKECNWNLEFRQILPHFPSLVLGRHCAALWISVFLLPTRTCNTHMHSPVHSRPTQMHTYAHSTFVH